MPPRRPKRAAKSVDYAQFLVADEDDHGDADVTKEAIADSEEEEEVQVEEVVEVDTIDEDVFLDEPTELMEEEPLEESVDAGEKAKKPKKSKKEPVKKAGARAKLTATRAQPKVDTRQLKDLTSVKEKFLRLFGHNIDKLSDLVTLREEWAHAMFDFGSNKMADPPVNKLDLPVIKTQVLTKQELDAKFPIEESHLKFQIDDGEIGELQIGSTRKTENITVLSTGTLITDIAWCPAPKPQLVAVSVSNITGTAFDSRFSLRSRNSYASGFHIYELDTKSGDFKLRNVLIHNWGNSWDLQWVAASKGFGSLCAVFNDGNVRVLNLGDLNKPIVEIVESSMICDIEGHILSTFDIYEDRLFCGTSTGYLVEFQIGEHIPSYLHLMHSDYIVSLRVGASNYDEPMIYTASSDCTGTLTSLLDIRTSQAKNLRLRTMTTRVVYSPQLYSFIQTDNPNPVKSQTVRGFFGTFSLTKHDGSAECISTSSMHPMFLSGGSDGKVKICNLARRILNGPKMTTHRVMTLFQLQYGDGLYRLAQTLEVEDTGSEFATVENIYPQGVTITSLEWSVNKEHSEWLAAGTTSGLLVLRKL